MRSAASLEKLVGSERRVVPQDAFGDGAVGPVEADSLVCQHADGADGEDQ
jgi:hypothetical protein